MVTFFVDHQWNNYYSLMLLTSVSSAWVLLMSISGGKMPDEKGRKLVINGETLAAATTAAIWLLACSVGDGAVGGGASCDMDEPPPPPLATAPPTPAPPTALTLDSLGRLTAALFAADAADGESFLAVVVVLPVELLADLRALLGAEFDPPAPPPPPPAPPVAVVAEVLPS